MMDVILIYEQNHGHAEGSYVGVPFYHRHTFIQEGVRDRKVLPALSDPQRRLLGDMLTTAISTYVTNT